MDVSGLGATSTRLLAMFERLGLSEGAELKSEGPSGAPSDKLVKLFQDLVDNVTPATQELASPIAIETSNTTLESEHIISEGSFSSPMDIFAEQASQLEAITHREGETVQPSELLTDDAPYSYEKQIEGIPTEAQHTSEHSVRMEHDVFSQHRGGASDNYSSPITINQQAQPIHSTEQKPAIETSQAAPQHSADESMQEVMKLFEQISSGNASPAELYRLQYLVGMLNTQTNQTSKVSQQTSQGLDTLLKQQG